VFDTDGGLVGMAVGSVGLHQAGGDAGAGPGVETQGSGVYAGGLFDGGVDGGVVAVEHHVVAADVKGAGGAEGERGDAVGHAGVARGELEGGTVGDGEGTGDVDGRGEAADSAD